MATNAQAFQRGEHAGYEETAWEGLKQSIDVIADKGIKVVINGGALNPKGLAIKVDELVRDLFWIYNDNQILTVITSAAKMATV
jgi:hypothetical protein